MQTTSVLIFQCRKLFCSRPHTMQSRSLPMTMGLMPLLSATTSILPAWPNRVRIMTPFLPVLPTASTWRDGISVTSPRSATPAVQAARGRRFLRGWSAILLRYVAACASGKPTRMTMCSTASSLPGRSSPAMKICCLIANAILPRSFAASPTAMPQSKSGKMAT